MISKRFRGIFTVLVICTMTLVLTGCNLRIGYMSKSSTKKMSASFYLLSETKKKSIQLENGDVITFNYELEEKNGELVTVFEDSSGNAIYTFEPNTDGIKEIVIDKDDTYELIIIADKARGSYKFEWTIN